MQEFQVLSFESFDSSNKPCLNLIIIFNIYHLECDQIYLVIENGLIEVTNFIGLLWTKMIRLLSKYERKVFKV